VLVNSFSQIIADADNSKIKLVLNSENGQQTVTIVGEYDGRGFSSSDRIVLADRAKPVLYGGVKKLLCGSYDFTQPAEVRLVR
jgi:hypothetical protein